MAPWKSAAGSTARPAKASWPTPAASNSAPFDEADLQIASDGIRDLLQRNGLYLSQISTKVDRDIEHQQVSFTFRVNSGRRARLTIPTIEGDTRIPPDEVAKAARFRGWFRWNSATDNNVQDGLRNVRRLYNKQDRLTADIALDHQEFLPATRQVRTTVTADGGPKITIRTEGAKVSKSKLQEYVPVYDEQAVNRDLLVTGVRNLRDYFQNRGYFDVEVILRKGREHRRAPHHLHHRPGCAHRVVRLISGRPLLQRRHHSRTDLLTLGRLCPSPPRPL